MLNALELPENVAMLTTVSRSWNGINVDLIEYVCTGKVLFQLERHENYTRLGTKLDEVGRGYAEPRSARNTPNPHPYKNRGLYLAPAEMALWGYAEETRYLKCAALSFDGNLLQDHLGLSTSSMQLGSPRLRIVDDRLWTLISLLTEAIGNADPTAQLYGDSITAAIVAKLCERPVEPKGSACRLSTIQLKDAIDYLDAKMPARVKLAELAKLAGLSQSHYSRAFRASTGLAPYQWQLQTRINRAKDLLLNTNKGLPDVASATGFADAVHFGRTFRRSTGFSPGAWRLDMLS